MKEINFILEKDINTIPAGSSLICNIEVHPAIVYGKLKSLFGEPTIETKNLEEQYYYCLSAQIESDKKICIYAYSGGSGPAIGGLSDTDSKIAAQTLIEMIQNADVVDYHYEGYYLDTESKVQKGIKDGTPYYEEEYCEDIPPMW